MATSEDGGGGTAAYECPIEGCQYVARDVQAVEGHVSGSKDDSHTGFLGRDVRAAIETGETVSPEGRNAAPSGDSDDHSIDPGGESAPLGGRDEATVDAGGEAPPESPPPDDVAGPESDAPESGANERVVEYQWSAGADDDQEDDGDDLAAAEVPADVAGPVEDGADQDDRAGGLALPALSDLLWVAAGIAGSVLAIRHIIPRLLGSDGAGDDDDRVDDRQDDRRTVGDVGGLTPGGGA